MTLSLGRFIMVMSWLLLVPMPSWASSEKPAAKHSGNKATNSSHGPTVEELLRFKVGDEKGNDIKAAKTEALAAASEEKALKQLELLLAKYRGSHLEPDLRARKAELFMRQAKTARFFEIHRDVEGAARLIPTTVKNASSRSKIEKAIAIYQEIQKRFIHYQNLDLIYFNTGFAYQHLGKHEIAREYYLSMVSKFENSALVPDALLAVGEIDYQKQQFGSALEMFDRIKKYPRSAVYPYALYKGAWALYNTQRPTEGLAQLEKVIAFGLMAKETGLDARLDLRSEALLDMPLFFEDVKPASSALGYFERQAGDLPVGPVIMTLGTLYERHGRYKDLITIFNEYVAKHPLDLERMEAHDILVKTYDHERDIAAAINELEKFSGICLVTHPWQQKNKVRDDCLSTLHERAQGIAIKWDKKWRSQGKTDRQLAVATRRAYEVYLMDQPAAAEVHEMRFSYAELLFSMEDYRRASAEYARVGQSAGVSKVQKLWHDADYAALLSLEKAVGDVWSDSDERHFQSLASAYLDHHPKGQYRVDIQFKRAFIGYEKGRYQEVAPQLKALGQQYAKTEKGMKAQDLYLDILNIQKNFAELRQASFDYRELAVTPQRRSELQTIYQQAYFALGDQQESQGKLGDALKTFKDFASNNKDSPLSEKAWVRMIGIEENQSNHRAAAELSAQLIKEFPNSPEGRPALERAVRGFENMALFELAASAVEELAKKDPEQAGQWVLLAGDYYELAKRFDRAEAQWKRLVEPKKGEKMPTLATQGRAWVKLLTLFQRTERSTEIRNTLKMMAALPECPERYLALRMQAEEAFSKGDWTKAFELASHVLVKGSQAAVADRAQARMVQAQVLDREFRNQSVKSSIDRLALVIGLKTERLEKMQLAYQSVISFGHAETMVPALVRLSEGYAHYVESLSGIVNSLAVSPEERELVKKEIDKLIVPMEEKSVETMGQALAQAKKVRLFNGTVSTLEARFDQLNMKKNSHRNREVGVLPMVVPKIVRESSS